MADGRYGNHRFLAPLRDSGCALLVRLRCDRVLYGPPGPHAGLGRPRKHGDRFAFKEPDSWPEPAQRLVFEDERFGRVEIRYWSHLHALEDADTLFAVLRIQTHLERDQPPAPHWLGWQGPEDYPAARLWRFYLQRPTLEQSLRWRNQLLYWTTPQFQDNGPGDTWSTLVSLAQWQLYLARDCVPDQPSPGAASHLDPFSQDWHPGCTPQTRGKSPGWPKGQPRVPRQRHAVVKKGEP